MLQFPRTFKTSQRVRAKNWLNVVLFIKLRVAANRAKHKHTKVADAVANIDIESRLPSSSKITDGAIPVEIEPKSEFPSSSKFADWSFKHRHAQTHEMVAK